MFKYSAKIILVGLLSLVILPLQISAQEKTAITVSPVVFELTADPGDSIQNQIKIFNPTREPIGITMLMEDFSPIGEVGEVQLSDGDDHSSFSVASWTEFFPSEFVIQPGQQQIVTFNIEVPLNAEPGGHYGSIVASSSAVIGDQVGGSAVTTKVGSLVLIRLSGVARESLAIKEFSAPAHSDRGPIEFTVRFENAGNVHVRPAGFINITDIFGKQVAQIEIPQNIAIPDAIRQANTTWSDVNLFGRYTATLVATYGATSKQTITATYAFTVIPVKETAIAVITILIFIVLLYSGRKRLSRAFSILVKGESHSHR